MSERGLHDAARGRCPQPVVEGRSPARKRRRHRDPRRADSRRRLAATSSVRSPPEAYRTHETSQEGWSLRCTPVGVSVSDGRNRCTRCGDDPQYVAYHDVEWGVPLHGDPALFELLTLEGAQAGLSWLTILRRREGYRRVFADFDPIKVARFSDKKMERILTDPGIVRNRQKVESVVGNAQAILRIQKERRSLDDFLWGLGIGPGNAPTRAGTMSKRLRTEGFRFVGPTICLSFMQASGMVNDHDKNCFRYSEIDNLPAQLLRPPSV